MPPMTFSSMAPLTAAEFLALPENTDIRLELQDGAFVVKPRPTPHHQASLLELFVQLHQRTPGLVPVSGVDVDPRLVPPDQPGTVRVPDLVVVPKDRYERVRDGTEPVTADDLVLVGEVIGPGSRRTDTVIEHADYADAGIGHYWIIDLDDDANLTACHLACGSRYLDAGRRRGVFETDVPFPAVLDLAALLE
ncbi:Uma2 family endonuclease [Pseudonocardia humida]|uniref:Uma2 family endonuclease n=1 Tax=Pseudonocardia humida TaxID=2800819 RepID=A0ABT1A3J2_9PSEU|nr:Uma2 family endonuclease [Pseudonocardia humida]MCO1657379.1 Uma2 family endonuclease [Pseudonocardia humida]